MVPVWPGDTLRAQSTVIGLTANSIVVSGVVWVRTRGLNQQGMAVLEYVRWVMVKARETEVSIDPVVLTLATVVDSASLAIVQGLDFARYDFGLAGEAHRWGNYTIVETIDHVDGVMLEEAEHMLATRLWQNTAKVHFDAMQRPDGKRLIHGGHIISLASGLSFNGLVNAQMIVGLNGGAHVAPCFAGDTVRAWSEVLDKAETIAPGVGAIWLRLVAVKHGTPPFAWRDAAGQYAAGVGLDLDYWALTPV